MAPSPTGPVSRVSVCGSLVSVKQLWFGRTEGRGSVSPVPVLERMGTEETLRRKTPERVGRGRVRPTKS